MIFYHGTTEEKWKLIQEEGVLWGFNVYSNDCEIYRSYRYTYLSPLKNVSKVYGDVLLEVEYDPIGIDGRGIDNYGFNPPKGQICWQFSVFVPISIENVNQIL